MKYRQHIIFILFSLVLNACGQQGPLFMPIENEPAQEPIQNNNQETGLH